VSAGPYELSKDDLTDPKGIASQDVSHSSVSSWGTMKEKRWMGW
jgi:hypothetical protein